MNSLEAAKLTLEDGGYTCVIASGGRVIFTSRERGVKPLVDYYRRQGKLREIDGSTTIEASTEATLRALEEQG